MKNIQSLIYSILVVVSISSCTKEINYDLTNTETKIVIEASMLKDSFAYARVTKTAEYLKNQPTPVVDNAFIIVTSTSGKSDTLNYMSNGYYKGNSLKGVFTDAYTLTVSVEGKLYTATTQLFDNNPFVISGVNVKAEDEGFRKKGYYPTIDASIPSGIDSYFLFKYFKNDSVYREDPSDLVVRDSKFIGNSLKGYETPNPYQLNDEAKILIYRITKESYDFYNDLQAQLNNDGGFFSTPPANTSTNFSNGAIGVFMGGSVYADSVVIKP